MKTRTRLLAAAALLAVTTANAADCIAVDYDHSPIVTLSGHITNLRESHKVGEDSRSARGRYLKLDSPISAKFGEGDCETFSEIPIDAGNNAAGDRAIARWGHRHVTVSGELIRFVSALVSPSIYIDVHNDNAAIKGTVLIDPFPGVGPN